MKSLNSQSQFRFSLVNTSHPLDNNGQSLIFSQVIAFLLGLCSGDHDMIVPYISTLAWIESMNFTIEEDWRPWFSNDQVAGFVYISV